MNSYYGELCTKVYESDKSMADGIELDFYLSFVENESVSVLEPMCGNGRMLLPFLQRGITIEGFDISQDMLNTCMSKAKKLGLEANVYYDRIESFQYTKTFDLIMIPFGSFSLLPTSLVEQSLTNLRRSLKDDGKLLLTIMIEEQTIAEIPNWVKTNKTILADEEITLYKRTSYDSENNLLLTELKYESIKDDTVLKTEYMNFPMRLYELNEFKEVLSTNGFSTITVHEVKDGYGAGSCFHVFECRLV